MKTDLRKWWTFRDDHGNRLEEGVNRWKRYGYDMHRRVKRGEGKGEWTIPSITSQTRQVG